MANRGSATTVGGAVLSVSPRRAAARRLVSHRLGLAGIGVLAIIFLATIFAPLLTPYDPNAIDPSATLEGVSAAHPMGTDELGRDILARVLFGGRVTLLIALGSTAVALVVGAVVGLVAGYVGGWVDSVLMRVVDGFIAFPLLILALVIVSVLGPSVQNAMIAVAAVNAPLFARMVRGQVLTLKERNYVEAAEALGVAHWKIIVKHVWPHAFGTVVVFASLRTSFAVLTESSLAFLGLGAQLPDATWGSMVSVGTDYLRMGWWYSVFPGLLIFLTVLSLNVVGDALRDAFDVRTGTSGQTRS